MRVGAERFGRRMLAVDSAANYLLGLPLLVVPHGTADLLGLPRDVSGFYPRVLGGVLTGIATALALEVRRSPRSRSVGLGVAGAIVVNVLGGGAIVLWLASSEPGSFPTRGRTLLWGVAGGVLGIGALEAWRELRSSAREGAVHPARLDVDTAPGQAARSRRS